MAITIDAYLKFIVPEMRMSMSRLNFASWADIVSIINLISPNEAWLRLLATTICSVNSCKVASTQASFCVRASFVVVLPKSCDRFLTY